MKAIIIKGSRAVGSLTQHMNIYNKIKSLLNMLKIPYEFDEYDSYEIKDGDIYIGVSKGCNKIKKISQSNNNKLLIAIGDVVDGVKSFKNPTDNALKGDLSDKSVDSHFNIQDDDIIELSKLISNFAVGELSESNNVIQSKSKHFKIPENIRNYYNKAQNRINAQKKCGADTFIGDLPYKYPVKDPFTCKFHCGLIHGAFIRSKMNKNFKVIKRAAKLIKKYCIEGSK